MQRKGNTINRDSQVVNQISVGIDMGGSLWATAVQDWGAGKMSYYGLKDKDNQSKEERAFELVSKLLQSGKRVDVFYEAGRYGYWPARKLIALGATVHILPINKLKVVMSGKTIKTDKLDAKFLGGLHPSDHVPKCLHSDVEGGRAPGCGTGMDSYQNVNRACKLSDDCFDRTNSVTGF